MFGLVRGEDQDMYVYGEKNYTDCWEEIILPPRKGGYVLCWFGCRIQDVYVYGQMRALVIVFHIGIAVTKKSFSSEFISRTALQKRVSANSVYCLRFLSLS